MGTQPHKNKPKNIGEVDDTKNHECVKPTQSAAMIGLGSNQTWQIITEIPGLVIW